jgi:hypothetical protein
VGRARIFFKKMKKALARQSFACRMRTSLRGNPSKKASPSGGLTLKNKIKTDVWALVGMVVK